MNVFLLEIKSTLSDFNRGNSSVVSKGHVKSASVSSPGPSSENSTAQTELLRQRSELNQILVDFKPLNLLKYSIKTIILIFPKLLNQLLNQNGEFYPKNNHNQY